MIIRILFLLMAFIFGTTTNAQIKVGSERSLAQAYHLKDSLLKIWRWDKYGCNRQRLAVVDSLFKPDIKNMPRKIFVRLFGAPDIIQNDGTCVYQNVMHCNPDHKPAEETSAVNVAVFFKNGRLVHFEKIFVD